MSDFFPKEGQNVRRRNYWAGCLGIGRGGESLIEHDRAVVNGELSPLSLKKRLPLAARLTNEDQDCHSKIIAMLLE